MKDPVDTQSELRSKDIRVPPEEMIHFSEPPLKVMSEDDTTLIHYVPKAILCKSSEYFKRALKPEWNEMHDEPNTVKLPVDDAESFKLYAHWLHFGKLPLEPLSPYDANKYYNPLARAYVLGEALLDTPFRNDIINAIIIAVNETGHLPMGRPTAIIYEGTPVGSPARQLMIDMCAHEFWDHPGWDEVYEDSPKEFLWDAMKLMCKLWHKGADAHDNYRPWMSSPQKYHLKEPVSQA